MLKLGTETASVNNWIMSGAKGEEPAVGMGATLLHWTDRTACTVVAWDGKLLEVQEDNAKRSDANGMSDSQSYTYTPNPNGHKRTYRLGRPKANGQRGWEQVAPNERGRMVKAGGPALLLGSRQQFHDFSF